MRRIGVDANSAQVAAALADVWNEIDTALTPIIGQRGVLALYKRTLHLASAVHPWLAGTHEGVLSVMDLPALKGVFSRQASADASVAGDAVLQTFHELLTTLVGPSLTERLLRSVWTNSSSGPPAQDTMP